MSAMTHNDEKDGYKNNTLVANTAKNSQMKLISKVI